MTDRAEIELCLAVYRTLHGLPPAQAIAELRRAVDAMPAELGPSVRILCDGAAEFLAALGRQIGDGPGLVDIIAALEISFLAYLSDCRARDEATRPAGWGYERAAGLMD